MDWASNETRDFVPDERQKLVIEVVRRATEEEKLYYTRDVYAFCVKQLNPSSVDLEKRTKTVEGGEVGMDLYYARQYLDARKRFALEDEAQAALKPCVSMKLGTLVFNDFKRITGAHIVAVDVITLTLQGKRGINTIQLATTALAVRNAMERAVERKLRKTNFAEFCDALHQPAQAKPTVAITEGGSASLF